MLDPNHPVVDPEVSEAIVETTPEWIGILLVPVTYLGSVFILLPLVIVAFWWNPERFGTWLPAFLAYYGIMGGIKSLNDATRPDVEPPVEESVFPGAYSEWVEHAVAIGTTSFPSGNAMVAALIVALMVVDLRISTVRRRAIVGAFVIAVVGFTRLGLGVHYPVDVVVGITLGIALLTLILWLRGRVEDEVGATFAVALVSMAAGLWVINGGLGVPTWGDLEGSLRVIAFGGAVGGLLGWRATRLGWWRETPMALAALGVAFVATSLAELALAHPLVTMVWAVATFALVTAIPGALPERNLESTFDRVSAHEAQT